MSARRSPEARRVSLRCPCLILFTALCLSAAGRCGAVEGSRTISFLPPVSYDKPGASGVLAADLDGDRRVDIAVAGTGGLSLFYGNGDGTFQPRIDLPLGDGINTVKSADVNGDGLPDLILTQGSRVVVLLNQGYRTYSHPFNYAIGSGPSGVTVGDFNGDGRPDLAVSNSGSNNMCVLLNKGDGTFGPAVFYPAGSVPGEIISADLHGSGHLDLAIANIVGEDVRVYTGDGTGKFTPDGDYHVGNGSGQVVAGDFNGDGKPDLAANAWWDNGISVLFGDGAGHFAQPISYGANGYPGGMASADLDGDGAPDLVHGNGGTSYFTVHQNAGDGNFLPPVTFASGGSNTRTLAVGDFNGDGLPDVVTSNESSGNIAVLINNTPHPTLAIRSLTLDTASVVGGCQTVTGTVTLTAPAPPQGTIGGVVVLLASSNPAVAVPAEILIPQGALQGSFSIVTPATATLQWASISASFNSTAKRASLAVRPMGPPQVTINPVQVIGGQTAAGQVTLPCPAGPAGLAVPLTSSSPLLLVPAVVTVPPGATTAAFPIRTEPVAAAAIAAISAGLPGAAATASLQLLPPFPPPFPVPAPAPPPPPQALNLLVNGSFEEPAAPEGGFRTVGPGGLPGWQILRGTVDVVDKDSWRAAPDGGRQSIDLVGTPGAATIEQSFPTEPGRQYLFAGWISHNPGNPVAPMGRADVSLNGQFFVQLLHYDPLTTFHDMRWVPFAYVFTATSPTTTLTLADVTNTWDAGGGLALDGLSVTPVAVGYPLPPPPVGGLPAPTNLAARFIPGAGIQLTWQDNSSDETAFAVWRRGGGVDWTRIAALAPHTTAYVDATAAPDVTYTYRVRAIRTNVASDWSNEVTVTTPAGA